ncbi:MAG: prepilin-type N-terminal cleavage/methylation domain-containing protein [Clostridia bacterium]|nr:prepilin-type N-terminal cleavage/methylation domain-containing protein [Clostridia bacterium]
MKKNNKGFTLAELLIVVAIIAVLVAIAIPVFTSQLEKSREATDLANVRAAYAEIVTQYLENDASHSITVKVNQKQSKWQQLGSTNNSVAYIGTSIGSTGRISVEAKTTGTYNVKISKSGKVTVD